MNSHTDNVQTHKRSISTPSPNARALHRRRALALLLAPALLISACGSSGTHAGVANTSPAALHESEADCHEALKLSCPEAKAKAETRNAQQGHFTWSTPEDEGVRATMLAFVGDTKRHQYEAACDLNGIVRPDKDGQSANEERAEVERGLDACKTALETSQTLTGFRGAVIEAALRYAGVEVKQVSCKPDCVGPGTPELQAWIEGAECATQLIWEPSGQGYGRWYIHSEASCTPNGVGFHSAEEIDKKRERHEWPPKLTLENERKNRALAKSLEAQEHTSGSAAG